MDTRTEQVLAELKIRQREEHLPCPRCGLDKMADNPIRNALSRAADIHVCDDCGTAEALRAFHGDALPLEDWACMKG